MAPGTYNVDCYVLDPSTRFNVDCYVNIGQFKHSVDCYVSNPGGLSVNLNFVDLAATLQFAISPNAYVRLAGTLLRPGLQFINLAATLVSPNNRGFVNLAATLQARSRQYIKLAANLSNDKLKSHSVDCDISIPLNLAYINLAATLVKSVNIGPCGSYPDAAYIKLAAWLVKPGGDSIQQPNQGFPISNDWLSSQDALASYKPTSVFLIKGSTLPATGIGLLITAFTGGVISFQTRTRTWLRRVDAAPSGILLTTKVNTHTLPNGSVVTTTTQTRQQQDTLVTITTIQNSATPARTSTIVTEKNQNGQTVVRETETNIINGVVNSLETKNVFTEPPTTDNVQPLVVRTLDGVIHYQFFGIVNPEWSGGEAEGKTTRTKAVQIVPGSLNGKTTDPFGNIIYNQITDEQETDPNGKVIQTHTEEIGTRKDIGTITTDTTSQFVGLQTTVTKTITNPDGSQVTNKVVTNQLTGDSVETQTETVTDEYGQVTTTATTTETKTFADPVTGVERQQITKTVNVTKGGVTLTDSTVETNNDFEDDIVSQKIKVYYIQEFTLTCVIDELSMLALYEIHATHQKNYALLELFGQQLGNANLSYALRQKLIQQFNAANACISPVTLQALGRNYAVVFAQSASAFRGKYIPGTEPHAYELQMILQSRSDLQNGTFGF